jgi:hypothetical protein
VKLTTWKGTKYFKRKCKRPLSAFKPDTVFVPEKYADAVEVRELDYNIGLDDESCANFDIKCKLIKTLKISLYTIDPVIACQINTDDEDNVDSTTSRNKPSLVQKRISEYFTTSA